MMLDKKIHISLFGTVNITVDQTQLTFATDTTRALFAYLLLTNQAHSYDSLITLLWNKTPTPHNQHELDTLLAQLQQTLYPACPHITLITTPQRVQLHLTRTVTVDAHQFQHHWRACNHHTYQQWWQCPTCIKHLKTAVSLHHTPLLHNLNHPHTNAFVTWKFIEAEQYTQQTLLALQALAQHALAHKNAHAAAHYAQQQLTLEPWHDVAQQQLLQAYAQMA